MAIELKVPSVGESITEVIVGTWMKKVGDAVEEDESVVELDTDKASQEIGAPAAGVLSKILKEEGDTAEPGEVIAIIDENGKPKQSRDRKGAAPAKKTDKKKKPRAGSASDGESKEKPEESNKTEKAEKPKGKKDNRDDEPRVGGKPPENTPSARATATGPGGRILKRAAGH